MDLRRDGVSGSSGKLEDVADNSEPALMLALMLDDAVRQTLMIRATLCQS